MNLLRLTQDGSLILSPAGHMYPSRVVKRLLPGVAICLFVVGGAVMITREQPGWASFGVYLVTFMIAAFSLAISLAMVLSQGTEAVPKEMKNEVLMLALHGGRRKGRRSTSIQISDEQYGLMRRLIDAQEKVRQANVGLDHAKRSHASIAPGLPHAYTQQVRAREGAALRNAEMMVAEAQSVLERVRADVDTYLDRHGLDEETCEFWQGLWQKNRFSLRSWDEAH